jgi:hypothetical protein
MKFEIFYLPLSAFFFVLHIVFENLSSFVRFNLAGHGWHMRGINYSNICAIISRGFVALYGVLIAVVVENGYSSFGEYCITFIFVMIVSSFLSFLFSRITLKIKLNIEPKRLLDFTFSKFSCNERSVAGVSIGWFMSAFVGVQFVTMLIAYGLSFSFFDYRLIIISFVPVASMVGTLVTVVLLEPRLSRIVDNDREKAFSVSSAFLRARSFSFVIASGLFLMLWVLFK